MGSGNMNVQSSSINISTQAYGGGGTLSLSSISSGLDGGHRLYVSADYLNMGGRIETYLNCAHSTLSIKGSSIALNTLGQIDITSNGGINLNSTSSIVLGYVADRTTSNVPMAGVNLTSSGVSLYTGTNNYGDTGSARINTYMNISSNGVTINQSGNIITFPKKRGTIALDSDALHRHNIEITGAGIYAVWKLFITMYYSSSTPFTSIVSLGSALAGPMYGEGGWLMSCHGYNPSSPSFAIIGVGYKSSVEPSGITL